MSRLATGVVTDAGTLALAHSPVSIEQLVSGAPTTGFAEVDILGDAEIGVWEMTSGAMRDVEADEVFVVLAGSATVSFDEPALASIELRPGSVVRLTAGMHTVWTVRETLRKLYITV